MALEFLPPVTAARLFTKDKYLEPIFGDVGQARTNAAMLMMLIATTSSHTCTKPTVSGSFALLQNIIFGCILKAYYPCMVSNNNRVNVV